MSSNNAVASGKPYISICKRHKRLLHFLSDVKAVMRRQPYSYLQLRGTGCTTLQFLYILQVLTTTETTAATATTETSTGTAEWVVAIIMGWEQGKTFALAYKYAIIFTIHGAKFQLSK